MRKFFAKLVGCLIPFQSTRRYVRDKIMGDSWRKQNPHNYTNVAPNTDTSCITVGVGSYGTIHVDKAGNQDVYLKIGNYVSIGPDVHFILASEHPYTGISTYPFKVMVAGHKCEAKSKGNIIIDDDVWIGFDAIINSGVHIGQGAIVASGSVVTKDVEPYSIVGGNPAKHIKYRFPSNIRKKLITLDFSKLDRNSSTSDITITS